MTMHMVHPGLTTLNTKKKKVKPSAKQLEAEAKHNVWLRSQGVHLDQLKTKRPNSTPILKTKPVVRNEIECGNGFAPGGSKVSIFDSQWKQTYTDDPVMAEREAAALRQATALKSQIAPAYSKGAYQLITKGADLTTLGKKV